MNGNYDNFNELFFQTYDGYGTTPKSKERFYYMLQRKQFFCEAVCQRFNLDKGVKFEREVITDNFGTHGTNCFFCVNKAGKRIKLCCGGDMVVDLASEKIFFLNENEMADNQLTGKDKKNNRVGFNFKKNELSVGSYEDKKILNVCNSTDNDKELFGAMIKHNKNMNNVFISNGYNNFLVSNQQQQNCPMVQMPALPMFNYCYNMGFYQNYNNLNNFFNMYKYFWSNNSYNYCMGQFYDNGKITQQANAQLYPYRQFTPQFMMNKLEAQMKIAKGLNTANFNRNLFISCPNQSDVKNFPSENLKRPADFMYNVNNDVNDANAFNNIKRNIGDNDNIINQDAINVVKTINDCNIKQLFNMNNEKQNNKKHRKRKNIKKQRQSRINKSKKFNAKLNDTLNDSFFDKETEISFDY